nr:hypothetical protein [Tanacetum cinerariifolium]
MGEPLSPDRVFDFPVDELDSHPAYDFCAPGPLLEYAGNPNNNNGWSEADLPLLGELEVVADEPMVGPIVDEIGEPIVKAKEQADDSEGFDEEEVWEVNEEWLMAPITPPSMSAVPPPSVYDPLELPLKNIIQATKIRGPSIAVAKGQSFPLPAHGLLIPPLVIEDLSTRLGTGFTGSSAQRDTQIQQLQTTVSEMSSRESTLMQCILGMDRRLAELERRPPGPQ